MTAPTSGPPVQLPLDLPWRPALGREDFLVANSSAAAVALIDAWPDWPGPAACLVGPGGAGKTHLAHVFAHKVGQGARVFSLPQDGTAVAEADSLALAASAPALVLEDAASWLAGEGEGEGEAVGEAVGEREGAPDRATRERTLFHLLNAVRQRGGFLLLTADTPPGRWPVALPDLASRLKALPVASLGPPDDSLLAAVVMKQFADRGLDVAPGVIAWLVPRMPRDFAVLRRLVHRADALALARGRAVTLPVMREALGEEMP